MNRRDRWNGVARMSSVASSCNMAARKGDSMEQTTVQPQRVPPQAIIMQMAMGGWVARTIAEIIRLEIPDVLKRNGPMTAAALVAEGVEVNAGALERVMRACTSLGLFTEDSE